MVMAIVGRRSVSSVGVHVGNFGVII